MLKELNYIVNGQTLTGESFKMASDTVNEIKVSFAFEGTDWSGLDSIKAVFSNNRVANSYEAVLVNGTCTIPHEVLAEKGTVSVNLYGSIITGTTLTTRITSYKSACVDVLQKVSVNGSNSVVPTPATWEQQLSAHTQNATVHVTAQNKTDWNAKVGEAPSDSKQYARKNGAWAEVSVPSVDVEWGDITGTLANQEDLAEALEEKADADTVYTKTQTDSAISNHHDSTKADASSVYTKTESDGRFALASAITDMATKTWVNAQGFITSLAGYATEAWVNAKNYATQSWVEAKGYLTEHQSLSAYRTSADQDVIDNTKVDKVEGKGLSSNDYTTAEKTKLSGIEANADVTDADNVKSAGAMMGLKVAGTDVPLDVDGKGNVPIGGADYGVIKRNVSKGFEMDANNSGTPFAGIWTEQQYNNASRYLFIGKGTLENIKDDYIKRGLVSNTAIVTDADKKACCGTIGAVYDGQYELIEEITLTEDDVTSIVRTQDTEGNPYDFKDVYVYLFIPISTLSKTVRWDINNIYIGSDVANLNNQSYHTNGHFNINGGRMFANLRGAVAADTNTSNYFMSCLSNGGTASDSIYKILFRFNDSSVLPVGTKLRIYAIRN